jgi:hypothetical protein
LIDALLDVKDLCEQGKSLYDAARDVARSRPPMLPDDIAAAIEHPLRNYTAKALLSHPDSDVRDALLSLAIAIQEAERGI